MQIPSNLDIRRLGRDPMQSLSTFYTAVKKFEHFQNQKCCPILTRKRAQQDKYFGQKSPKLFVQANNFKFLSTWIS